MSDHDPSPITREQFDGLVADAISMWPNATIDPDMANDLSKFTRVLKRGDVLMPLLKELALYLGAEMAKPVNDQQLSHMDIVIANIAPRLYQHVEPKNHIIALFLAVIAAGVMAGHFGQDHDALHAAATNDDEVAACLNAVLELMSKEQQVEEAIALLERRRKHSPHLQQRKTA